jgi:hypothetical protein
MTCALRTCRTLLLLVIVIFTSACADSGGQQLTQVIGPSSVTSAAETMGSSGDSPAGMRTGAAFTPATIADSTAFNPFGVPSSRQAVQSQPLEGTVIFDGTSAASILSERPATAAFSGVPSLVVTLDLEGRRVTLDWTKGPGDDPLSWRLYYQLPIGGGGFFDFLLGQTSVTADLPFGGLFTAEICAYNGGPYETGCVRSPIVPFTLPTLTSNVPNKPELFRGSANESTVTFSWNAPLPGGGAPTTYVLVYNGQQIPVGNVFSVTYPGIPPGRYLVALFARNAAGSSPLATTEVTVGGTTAAGVYAGPFSGTGSITRIFTSATCNWQSTMRGTVTITLTQQGDGLAGTINVSGSRSEPQGTSNNPNFTCLAGDDTFSSTNPAIISGTSIARTAISMGVYTGTFSGRLDGSTITGTLTANYNNGSGSIAMPMTLTRTIDER